MDTMKHIEALQAAAIDLEDRMRRSGLYTADCSAALDAIVRRGKKTGIALLFDEHGEMEVVDLNGGSEHIEVSKEGQHVTIHHGSPEWHHPGPSKEHTDNPQRMGIESTSAYEQVNPETFKGMAAKSHERENVTSGKFSPVNHEGPQRSVAKAPTGDAVRLAAELKSKQERNTADQRRFNQQQYARNEAIAQKMKAISDKQWKIRS